MITAAEITNQARDIAEAMRGHQSSLPKKKAELEELLRGVDGEIASQFDINERFADFQPNIGDDLQCPYCWMYDRAQRPLSTIGADVDGDETANEDVLRCHACGNLFRSNGEGSEPG